MKPSIFISFLLALGLAGFSTATAVEPVDPDLIPEARKVLDYLESVYGKKTLTGMASYGGWRPVYEMSGRAPAIYGNDAFGWNKPKWGPSYCKVLQGAMDSTRDWWLVKGGIPQLQFHWGKPGDPNGSAWVGGGGGNKGTGPVDMGQFITPGTAEHTAAMEDLKQTADYLEQLAQARVPVLWRPFHEIDGGWFWWTDKEKPENTAAAWRMMFDYFVKQRKLHNLIWVFNPGVHAGGYQQLLRKEKRTATLADEIAFRKRYYPGEKYVDLAGIDIYPNSGQGYGSPTNDTYPKAYEIMQQVAPGKILALCETAALVDPEKLHQEGPGWLYVLPWFAGGANPPDWIRQSFNHAQYLTLDELPPLGTHNVAPHVRLVQPTDGAEIGSSVEVKAVAGDRNGNLKEVEFCLLPGPWKDWAMRANKDFEELLPGAVKLGPGQAGAGGEYTLTWSNIRPGLYDLVAAARDAEGRQTFSSVARVAAGLKNLARGKTATTSSGPKSSPDRALDGDLFQSWSGDKQGEQWLAVDLGAEQTFGAVSITWWKAYARAYAIEVSTDGAQWREVFRQPKKTGYIGDTDVIRFPPAKARHVRLKCTERGTDWGGYTVYEFGVYPGLPEQPIPAGLDWDAWSNQAPLLPYNEKLYNSFSTYRCYDGGQVTNWVHGQDMLQLALGADETGPVEIWPIADYQGQPELRPVQMRYADGTLVSFELESKRGPDGGAVFLGEDCKVELNFNKYTSNPPDFIKDAPPPMPMPDEQGVGLWTAVPHLENWLDCIKTRNTPHAPLEIGHRSTSVSHLMNLCRQLGRKLRWDPKLEQCVGDDEANALLSRPRRRGYELPESA